MGFPRAPVVAAALAVSLSFLAGSATAGESAFGFRTFARGFSSPVLLTYAPGETTTRYVVEQPGRVLRLRGTSRQLFLDIRRDVEFGGEQGLLGLAFDPNYAKNRFFYVAYTSVSGRNVVERFRSNGRKGVLSSRKTLLSVRDPYGNHNGGHLAFGPDGKLYTSIGDGGSGGDPEDRSQDMSSLFGKLLQLDVRKAGAKWKIAALGLRNPWRFSFDRETKDLYIGDVGQNAVEEVSYTPRRSPGLENYGWDLYEGSSRFESGEPSAGKLVFPVFEYSHDRGCTVIGGYVYRGKARKAEVGRYITGDYCSGTIWSFRVEGGEAKGVRTERFKIRGLTSFGEDAAGELYATASNGRIYRLT